MRHLAVSTVVGSLLFTQAKAVPTTAYRDPLPLIIWHGLGDQYDNDGLHSVGELANQVHPNTHVHYIRLSDDGGEDRKATFLGDLDVQIAQVCAALGEDDRLVDKSTGRVRADALGFSQGGQFLRGLVERCPGMNIRTLMTFGSQHNGIVDVQGCGTWDFLCKGALALMKGNVWSAWAQANVIPAQYFRTVDQETGRPSQEYLENSRFLADVNNERENRTSVYGKRLAGLDMFVMFMFEDDTTVVPKESGWFAEVNRTSEEVTPLREREIYTEDWIGLKALDEKKGLACLTTPGNHMQLDEPLLKEVFELYFGPERTMEEKKALGSASHETDGCGMTAKHKWGEQAFENTFVEKFGAERWAAMVAAKEGGWKEEQRRLGNDPDRVGADTQIPFQQGL